eukprot:415805_1
MSARTINCGQMCISPDYVLCHENKIDEFLNDAALITNKWFGDDYASNKYLGKIVNNKQFNRVIEMLNNTAGDIVYGGNYNENELKQLRNENAEYKQKNFELKV